MYEVFMHFQLPALIPQNNLICKYFDYFLAIFGGWVHLFVIKFLYSNKQKQFRVLDSLSSRLNYKSLEDMSRCVSLWMDAEGAGVQFSWLS